MRTHYLGWILPFYFFAVVAVRAEIKIVQVIGASSATACDGEIEVMATGSAGPFQIQLIKAGVVVKQSPPTRGKYRFKGVCWGDYTARVFNAVGCSTNLSASVPNCRLDDWDIIGTVTRSCEPLNNGMVSIAVGGTGVTPPLQYYWSHGVVGTPLVSNLAPGDYGVVVIDARGCRDSKVFEVPSSSMSIDHHFVFNGPNQVSIKVTPNATDPPINYVWSNGATTQNLDNVTPAWYRVTATNSLGCQAIGVFNPAACGSNRNLQASIDKKAVTLTRIPLTVSGGNAPLTYQWKGPNGFTANTQSINITAQGTYCVTVKDNCGQGASLCQEISCAGKVEANALNQCLTSWNQGNGIISVRTLQETNCDKEIFVKFQEDDWEPAANGIWNQTIYGGGTFCISVKNSCGCVLIPRRCFAFASNRINVIGFAEEAIENFTPANYDGSLPVIGRCFACEVCAQGTANLPDPIRPQHCDDSPNYNTMTYIPSASSTPCVGGQITCGGLTLDVPPWAIGIEIVDWNANPEQSPSGECVLPSGCLFIGNVFTDPPLPPFQQVNPPGDRLVYVTNPLGHPAIGVDCAPRPCPDVDVIIDPVNPNHPTDPCVQRQICKSTGALVGWVGRALFCACRNASGDCFVIETCAGTENPPCTGVISTCADYAEDHPDELFFWCSGYYKHGPNTVEDRMGGSSTAPYLKMHGTPNPFDERLTLKVMADREQDLTLLIYNQHGQLMQRWAPQTIQGILTMEINTKNFTNGVYYFSIVSNSGQRIGLPLIKVAK